MKIRVYLKDPDGFWEGVDEAVQKSLQDSGLPKDEQDSLKEIRTEKAWKSLSPFVEFQEYVWLEFDTEERTATVVPLKDIRE